MDSIATLVYDYVFPNYYLPNALDSERAIINFMNSKYSEDVLPYTARSRDHIYDFYYERQAPMWEQSSVGVSICHPCMREIIKTEQMGIKEQLEGNERMIYPINIGPHMDTFTGTNRAFPMNAGEYFFKNMSRASREMIKYRKGAIFLDYALENFVYKHEYEELHRVLDMIGFHKDDVIIGINAFNAKEVYNKWFPREQQRLKVLNIPFLMYVSSFYYDQLPEHENILPNVMATKNKFRKNHFLFKIKQPRRHRQYLLLELFKNGNLNKFDWSYLRGQLAHPDFAAIKTKFQSFSISDASIVDKINPLLPKNLEAEPEENEHTVHGWSDKTQEPYLNSYFYVCTETSMGNDISLIGEPSGKHETKFLTEKVFKPIANLMPFVMVAYPGVLKELRDQGFQTFSPFIDESYDEEIDADKRLNMILNEINRLSQMSIEEMHRMYWHDLMPILEHNYNTFRAKWKTRDQFTDDIQVSLRNRDQFS